MAKSVQILIPEKKDAMTRIKKFMSKEESGIELTAKEEAILNRLIFANALLSEKKYTREEIAQKIKDRFGVALYTARNDIDASYSLFVTITEDYKRFALFHHIEDINATIREWSNDKSLAPMLPKLFAEKTRAIAQMPVTVQSPDVAAPVIIINTTTGVTSPMDIASALEEADKLIEFEKNHDYIPFDENKDEPE